MIQAAALIKLYDYNATLLHKQLAGLTHAESLAQPPFNGNCINWLVGHLVSARTRALEAVHQPPVWSDDIRVRYRGGSAAITEDGAGVLPFERLMADFDLSHERLVAGLQQISYEELCQPSRWQEGNSVADSLAYFQFHEAHHVGQIMQLASLLGRAGVWL